MEVKIFREMERFTQEKPVHVPLFTSERAKVILLCLSAGVTTPPHSHPGFDVTLQPLKGKGLLPVDGGPDLTLLPGEIYFVDGANSFSPKNPFADDFTMLIYLIKR